LALFTILKLSNIRAIGYTLFGFILEQRAAAFYASIVEAQALRHIKK
jgi:hypothetical protein